MVITVYFNAITRRDRYPIPHIHNITAIIQDKSLFSKLDLIRAYNQLPVEPADIPKTVISTPFGLFEFVRQLFSLHNAGQTFQRFIDHVLHGLDFECANIDDVLVVKR